VSAPSHYGLFTGEYPWRRKGTGVARGEYDNVAEKNHLKVRFFKQIFEEEKSKGVNIDL
jgi:hypothetical protein